MKESATTRSARGTWSNLRRTAVEAVVVASEATRVAHDTFSAGDEVAKADASPVTIADYAAQALICHRLLEAHPEVPCMGEEEASRLRGPAGEELLARVAEIVRTVEPTLSHAQILEAIDAAHCKGGASGRFWAIDPIDGTKGFLKRNGQWAVALGLVEDGAARLGVLGCPALPLEPGTDPSATGVVFVGVVGEGAYQRGLNNSAHNEEREIHVARGENLPLIVAESAENEHKQGNRTARIREAIQARMIPMDSQAKYALLARGEATVYLRVPVRRPEGETLWDHVAGVALVEAAGGRVTDLRGKALDFSRGTHIASNHGILGTAGPPHETILAAIEADYAAHPPHH